MNIIIYILKQGQIVFTSLSSYSLLKYVFLKGGYIKTPAFLPLPIKKKRIKRN